MPRTRTAEFVCKWFTKGMLAVVCGQIQSRNWEDKHGNKRTSIEVKVDELQFGESKKSRESGSAPNVNANDFNELDDDSDVPF